MEEKSKNVELLNKSLYKLLLYILKIIPFLLAINETAFTILHYYDIKCFPLNFFGGFSIVLAVQLYIMSYVFHYCRWHRVPIHYITIVNLISLYDMTYRIPLSDLLMLRLYLIIAGISLLYFIYLKVKGKC